MLRSYSDHEAVEVKLAGDGIDDGDVEDYPEAIREVDDDDLAKAEPGE